MGLNLNYIDGQTPIDEDEKHDLSKICTLKCMKTSGNGLENSGQVIKISEWTGN